MMKKRKECLVVEMEEEKKLWDKLNPYFIDRKWNKPEGYQDNPKYTSVNQMRDVKRRNERIEVELTAEVLDLKIASNDPGVGYVK